MTVINFILEHGWQIVSTIAVVSEVLGFTKVGGIARALLSIFKKK